MPTAEKRQEKKARRFLKTAGMGPQTQTGLAMMMAAKKAKEAKTEDAYPPPDEYEEYEYTPEEEAEYQAYLKQQRESGTYYTDAEIKAYNDQHEGFEDDVANGNIEDRIRRLSGDKSIEKMKEELLEQVNDYTENYNSKEKKRWAEVYEMIEGTVKFLEQERTHLERKAMEERVKEIEDKLVGLLEARIKELRPPPKPLPALSETINDFSLLEGKYADRNYGVNSKGLVIDGESSYIGTWDGETLHFGAKPPTLAEISDFHEIELMGPDGKKHAFGLNKFNDVIDAEGNYMGRMGKEGDIEGIIPQREPWYWKSWVADVEPLLKWNDIKENL